MKVKTSARIVSIISSILTIVFVCGKWFEFKWFYSSGGSKYTIFDISDFFEFLSDWANSDYEILAGFFSVCAAAVIIISIIFIILMLLGKPAGKAHRVIAFIASAVVFGGFLILLAVIDDEVKRYTSRGLSSISNFRIEPYLMIVTTIITCIFSGKKIDVDSAADVTICEKCSARLPENARFCTSCGAEVVKNVQNDFVIYCSECGTAIDMNSSFCGSCSCAVNTNVSAAPDTKAYKYAWLMVWLILPVIFILRLMLQIQAVRFIWHKYTCSYIPNDIKFGLIALGMLGVAVYLKRKSGISSIQKNVKFIIMCILAFLLSIILGIVSW